MTNRRPLRLLDALYCQCRFETGRNARNEMLVCGAPVMPARSYCADHIWRVYQPGTALKPKPARDRDQRAVDLVEREPDLTEVLS